MAKSMTGYGRSVTQCGDYAVTVEIKSVNSRSLEINSHLPRQFALMEDSIKRAVQGRLNRGKVDLFLSYEYKNEKRSPITIDKQAFLAYYNKLRDICDLYGIKEQPSLMQICSFPNVMQTADFASEDEDLQPSIMNCVNEALDALIELRKNEGARLTEDLLQRIARIEHLNDKIAVFAPQVACDYRDRLYERISQVLKDVPVDEARILQEAAIFADKADIAEEITRLRSHAAQFRNTVKEDEPVGRTLDFIVQEMNREVNTIGSKANFTDITKLVIEAKSELEKVREQVQNLE